MPWTLLRPRVLILAVMLGVLLAGLALVWGFRGAILERVIVGQLQAMGLPQPRLAVTEAGFSRLTIESLRLGLADEATVARIEVTYDVFGEGASPVERVRIERPRFLIDLAGGGPPLGSLQALLSDAPETESAQDRGPPPLPEIELVEGLAILLTPFGPADVVVAGRASSDAEGGLSADLSYEASGGPARLRGRFTGGMAADGAASGRLAIEEGAIALTADETGAGGGIDAEIGGLTGELEGLLRDGRPERLEGRLVLTDLGLEQARFRDASLTFALSEETVTAQGRLRATDDRLRSAFQAELRDPFGEAAFGLGLSMAASADAALFDLVGRPLSAGQGLLTLQAAGRLPAPPPEAETGGPLARLLGGEVAGRFTLGLTQVAVPETLSGLDLSAEGSLRLGEGALTVSLEPGAAGSLGSIAPARLASLGLPPALEALLAEGLRFGLEPVGPSPAGLVWRPGDGAQELQLDGRLTAATPADEGGPRLALELREALVTLAEDLAYADLPDIRLVAADLPLPGVPSSQVSLVGGLFGQADELEAELLLRAASDRLRQGGLDLRDLDLQLPLRLTLLKGALEAGLSAPGRIDVARLSHASGLRLTRPARLTLAEGTLLASPPSPEGTGGDRFAHDLRGRLGALALSYAGGDGAPIAATLKPARLKLIGEREGQGRYRGRLQLSGGGVSLPDFGASLAGLGVRLDFDATFGSPALSLNGDLAYQGLPPLRLDATARKRGQRVSFEAALGAASGPLAEQGLRPQISGEANLADGSADVALAPLRLSFAPGLLQPSDLAPQLAELQRVTGDVALQAAGAYGAGQLRSRGTLQVRDLGLTRADIKLEDLDLDLALDSLWPPRSPPGQRLTIGKLESALPVENIEARFRLLPGVPAKAEIADLSFSMAGSRFQVRQALLDPAGARHDLRLELASLDLQRLLGEVAVEGLSGSGQLRGVLPVSMQGQTVVIRDGSLESTGPGILSYRREGRGPALPAGVPVEAEGEEDALALLQDPVELTMRALENFHYDRLAIRVDKQAGGEAALKVQLEGKNPDLLDGYPFNLNINLTGDLTPVLDALSRGIDITQELVSRSWRLQP